MKTDHHAPRITHHRTTQHVTHNTYLVPGNISQKQTTIPWIMARELSVHLGQRRNGQSQHVREPIMDYQWIMNLPILLQTVVGGRVESAHANITLTLPPLRLLLLCAEAVHVSIHNRVSIQICRRFLRRGHEKKTTEKNRVGFSVSFFLGNRKTEKTPPKKTTFGFGSQPCLVHSYTTTTLHYTTLHYTTLQ